MERLTKRRKDGHAEPARFTQFIGEEMDDKLADYEDAEENGLLIVLPCRIGETIYYIDYDCSCGYTDYCETIDACEHCKYCIPKINEDRFDLDLLAEVKNGDDNFITQLYLTREEAEAKLREMEDNNE